MTSIVNKLRSKGLLNSAPYFIEDNTHYEVMMGSVAYGVSDDTSDVDVYGFCMPPKEQIFPHLAGEVLDFSTPANRFTTYQQHHIQDKDSGKEYDLCIYSIQRFFRLCMENNPNMVDALFVPNRCILHSTAIGQLVREHRRLFLHKGCWPKFKGYSYGQKSKLIVKKKNNEKLSLVFDFLDDNGLEKKLDFIEITDELKRRGLLEGYDEIESKDSRFTDISDKDLLWIYTAFLSLSRREKNTLSKGMDTKFGYHVVRLLLECEQILTQGDLDLEANRDQLRYIKNGGWSIEKIEEFFKDKEKQLEKVYAESKLPWGPDEEAIHKLLMNCIESHYGSIDSIPKDHKMNEALIKISKIAYEATK